MVPCVTAYMGNLNESRLENLQEFCKTTLYFDILAKRRKISSNSLVKELLIKIKSCQICCPIHNSAVETNFVSAPPIAFFLVDQSKLDA
jgi:hypothetical protein